MHEYKIQQIIQKLVQKLYYIVTEREKESQ